MILASSGERVPSRNLLAMSVCARKGYEDP
jgi:hypothetical protein